MRSPTWNHPHFTDRIETLRELCTELKDEKKTKQHEAVAWAVGVLMVSALFEAFFDSVPDMSQDSSEMYKRRNLVKRSMLAEPGACKRCP